VGPLVQEIAAARTPTGGHEGGSKARSMGIRLAGIPPRPAIPSPEEVSLNFWSHVSGVATLPAPIQGTKYFLIPLDGATAYVSRARP